MYGFFCHSDLYSSTIPNKNKKLFNYKIPFFLIMSKNLSKTTPYKIMFDLDKDLIFTKSKYEVPTFIPNFPGRQPKADVKVLAPLDSAFRIFETPYFENGNVVLLNISPTVGNDKWLKKGVMMKLAHLGYKPLAINLPIDEKGQINENTYFKTDIHLGKLLFDALHMIGIQHEKTFLVFGGPVGCVVFPYLMKIRDLWDDPLTNKKTIPDHHFQGMMMVTPDFCNVTLLEFEKHKDSIDEKKFWIMLNQGSDDIVDIYRYKESFSTAEWFEIHEELEVKEERNSKMWPLKDKNVVFMKYFKQMIGVVDEDEKGAADFYDQEDKAAENLMKKSEEMESVQVQVPVQVKTEANVSAVPVEAIPAENVPADIVPPAAPAGAQVVAAAEPQPVAVQPPIPPQPIVPQPVAAQ